MKLAAGVKDTMQREKDRLQRSGIRLELLDPSLVLKRGYAWLSDQQGVPITRAAKLSPKQPVNAVLGDGEVALEVTQVRLNSLK